MDRAPPARRSSPRPSPRGCAAPRDHGRAAQRMADQDGGASSVARMCAAARARSLDVGREVGVARTRPAEWPSPVKSEAQHRDPRIGPAQPQSRRAAGKGSFEAGEAMWRKSANKRADAPIGRSSRAARVWPSWGRPKADLPRMGIGGSPGARETFRRLVEVQFPFVPCAIRVYLRHLSVATLRGPSGGAERGRRYPNRRRDCREAVPLYGIKIHGPSAGEERRRRQVPAGPALTSSVLTSESPSSSSPSQASSSRPGRPIFVRGAVEGAGWVSPSSSA